MSEQAIQMLNEVEALRERTRKSLRWGWAPFAVFGVANLLSAPFTQIGDGLALGIFWLFAGPIGCLVTMTLVRRLELRSGVFDRHERFYAVVIGGMVIAATVVGFSARGLASDVGPVFPIGVGLVVIAAFDRSRFMGAAGTAVIALGVALAVAAPANADTWAAIGEGLIFIAASRALWRQGSSAGIQAPQVGHS